MPAQPAEHLPNCRLFLMPPSTLDAGTISACIAAAADAGDVACLVLPADKKLIEEVLPMAQQRDIAVLVSGDSRSAAYAGADGVHLATPLKTSKPHAQVSRPESQHRLRCVRFAPCRHGSRRKRIDYLAFDLSNQAGQDLLEWWTPLFEVPCVGINAADEASCIAAIEAGADFIMPPDAMWQSADAAAESVGPSDRGRTEGQAMNRFTPCRLQHCSP
jgi:thiamine-phosphate pyrophosphorylase